VLGVGLGADEYGDFGRFGETTGIGTRAAMADEALEIIGAMWAGRAHRSTGHYHVDLPAGEPEPHPVPVWVAATLPEVRSAHRAARFDGAVLQGPTTPENVQTAVHTLRDRHSGPFEIALTGNASQAWENPNPDGVSIDGLTDAGMTWWLESMIHFDPLDMTMDVVDAGPAFSPAR
jgi:hypothetical protein